MSKTVSNLTLLKWRCGRCNHWNDIEHGTCKQCKAVIATAADAFRVENVLTHEEKNFYVFTAPAILRELSAIRQLLEGVLKNETRELVRRLKDREGRH